MPITGTPPPAKKNSPAQPRISKKAVERKEAIDGLFQMGTAGLILAKQHADAEALALHGEKVAVELAALAEQNEKVGSLIDKLTEVGPYAGIIAACMPLILQVLVNHGSAQPGIMGTVSPGLLEAKAKTRIDAAEAAIRLEIEEQEKEAARINGMRENVSDDI